MTGVEGHQLIGLDRCGALMSLQHPLARAETVRLADLAATGIWSSLTGGPPELTGYWERLAKQFDVPLITGGANLGIEHIAQQLLDHPTRVIVLRRGEYLPGAGRPGRSSMPGWAAWTGQAQRPGSSSRCGWLGQRKRPAPRNNQAPPGAVG